MFTEQQKEVLKQRLVDSLKTEKEVCRIVIFGSLARVWVEAAINCGAKYWIRAAGSESRTSFAAMTRFQVPHLAGWGLNRGRSRN